MGDVKKEVVSKYKVGYDIVGKELRNKFILGDKKSLLFFKPYLKNYYILERKGATTTLSLNPNIETFLLSQSTSYDAAWYGNIVSFGGPTRIGQAYASYAYSILRTFLRFDTRNIYQDAEIELATLKLYFAGYDATQTDFIVKAKKWTNADNYTDILQEWRNWSEINFDDNSYNTQGKSMGYYNLPISSSLIHKGHYSGIVLLSSRDINRIIPTGYEYFLNYFATPVRIELEIKYNVVSTYDIKGLIIPMEMEQLEFNRQGGNTIGDARGFFETYNMIQSDDVIYENRGTVEERQYIVQEVKLYSASKANYPVKNTELVEVFLKRRK